MIAPQEGQILRPARPNRYQSVSVAYPSKCCAAIKALAGQRVLACDAPSLPLPSCTLAHQCKCRFEKYDDRRDDERRFVGTLSRWYGGSEKRRSRGRRGTD